MAGASVPEYALRMRGVAVTGDSSAAILSDLDWQLVRGQVATIVGPSGSGKSHMLRVLNRLTEISGGELDVLGRPIADWPVGQLRRTVGWVAQRPMLQDGVVSDILDVPRRLGLISAKQHKQRLPSAMEAVDLPPELIDRSNSKLSGGERHRVAIARALLLEPQVLLLDEPSGALDGASAARMLDCLCQWARERSATLIVVSHRIEDVMTVGGTVVVLDGGRIVRQGAAHTLLDDASGYDVRKLLTGRGPDRGPDRGPGRGDEA